MVYSSLMGVIWQVGLIEVGGVWSDKRMELTCSGSWGKSMDVKLEVGADKGDRGSIGISVFCIYRVSGFVEINDRF